VDENAHAVHFFVSALLQMLDRAGSLYGELARFVLRILFRRSHQAKAAAQHHKMGMLAGPGHHAPGPWGPPGGPMGAPGAGPGAQHRPPVGLPAPGGQAMFPSADAWDGLWSDS
jgi:peroxin-13